MEKPVLDTKYLFPDLNVLGTMAAFTCEQKGFDAPSEANIDRKLLLAVSEICEAQNEIRDGHNLTSIRYERDNDGLLKPEGVPVELADAVIRIADICRATGIDLTMAVAIKMSYNVRRPDTQGRLF